MADKRSYSAGHFMLSLDGEPELVKDFDGGNVKGEVFELKNGPHNLVQKHISTIKYEDFTFNIGLSMGKPLYEWIKASLDRQYMRKNGYVVSGSFDYKAMGYRHFRDALITEITIPALDATSKEPIYATIKLRPEAVQYAKGDNAELKGQGNAKQKKWLCSNFRLELGDLPTKRLSKIDSFTIKQEVVTDDVGEAREATIHPASLTIPNLKLTFSASDVEPWMTWFEDFVIKGNNGQEKELNGRIVFLDPSLSEELGSVDLFQVGIFALAPLKLESGQAKIMSYTAELYVERMQFSLNYV